MLIRKNTKAFKTILEIITACQTRPDRENLIRLYITRAGHTLKDRISVEGIQGEAAVFYEMNYQAVLTYLNSSNHQLQSSDEFPGIYFFRSSSNKVWDEMPFEFDEAIKKEFSALPELPIVRKKEKAEKFVFPAPSAKKQPPVKKSKPELSKPLMVVVKEPKQPTYKLKQKIQFTDVDKIVFRSKRVSKKDVLDYYDRISEYILPYLRDHPQLNCLSPDRFGVNTETSIEESLGDSAVPEWIQTISASKGKMPMFLCNDRDHLMWYVEMGCLGFCTLASRIKSLDLPDYILIAIDTADAELEKVIEVSLIIHEALTALKLPSFVKTAGFSALHICIPLDSKSKFQSSKSVAEYICKLIKLKIPDQVILKGVEEAVYGKVSLDFSINDSMASVVIPYSFTPGELPIIAAPLEWEELTEGFRSEEFNHETIFKRLKQSGDPFENFNKKKVNADSLLERLEENYSFLF